MSDPMRITAITASNFKSITNGTLNLEADGTHLITGPNGTGKTSYLDAALFALFGLQGHPAADYTTHTTGDPTENTTTVDVQFTTATGDHHVRRTITTTRTPTGDLKRKLNGDIWTNGTHHEGLTPAKITPRIEAIIGMPAAAYTSATFIRQTETASLSTATPTELEQIIEHYTDLHDLTRARADARSNALTAEKTADALPGDPDDVAEAQERYHEARQAVTAAEEDVTRATAASTDADHAVTAAEATATELSAKQAAAARTRAEHDAAVTRAHDSTAAAKNLEQDIISLADTVNVTGLQVATGGMDTTVAISAVDSELATLTDTRDNITSLATAVTAAATETTAATTATEQADRSASAAGTAMQASITGQERAAAAVTEAQAAADAAGRQRNALAAQRTTVTTSRQDATGRQYAATARAHTLDKALDALAATTTSQCPTCQSHLDDTAALIAEITQQRDDALADADTAGKEIDHCDTQLRELDTTAARLDDTATALTAAQQRLVSADADLQTATRNHAQALDAASAATDTAATATKKETTARNNLTAALTALGIDYASDGDNPATDHPADPLAAAREAYRHISSTGNTLNRLRHLLTELDAARTAQSKHQEALDAAAGRLTTAPTDEEIAAATAAVTSARGAAADAARKLSAARAVSAAATAAHLGIDTELANHTALWDAKRTAMRAAAVSRGVADLLAALRADLIHTCCSTISTYATAVLDTLSDEYGAVAITNGFTIEVTRRNGQRRLARGLSGGEWIIVGLALRIGISHLLTSGVTPPQILADEIDDGLDDDHRSRVMDLLSDRFASIVLVTHGDAPAGHHIINHHLHRDPLGTITADSDGEEEQAA